MGNGWKHHSDPSSHYPHVFLRKIRIYKGSGFTSFLGLCSEKGLRSGLGVIKLFYAQLTFLVFKQPDVVFILLINVNIYEHDKVQA